MTAQVFDSKSGFAVRMQVLAEVLIGKLRTEGVILLALRVLRRCALELCWMLSLPVAAILHAFGVRRLVVRAEHIGHLAEEINTYLKERALGLLPKRHCFVLAPPGRVANQHLLNYWREHVLVIAQPWICSVLLVVTRRFVAVTDLTHYTADYFDTQDIYRVCKAWGERPPMLRLSEDDDVWSRQALERIGVPAGRWFVCVHVREGGFLPHNELIQAHRNADVNGTFLAMAEIVRRGGICIRMGDGTMKRLPPMDGVIDYAHHPDKSARLDVVLCAKTKFFLGCTSGLAFVSTAFGVPVAHANMIPVAARGINRCDISIPKLIFREESRECLSLKEILGSPAANFFFSRQYRGAGLVVQENSPEDILDLVLDMFDQLDGNAELASADIMLAQRFDSLFKPGHYSYGAVSKPSIRFLKRRYAMLFDDPQ